MNTYLALFRGINVGGHNRIPMKELREIIEACGYRDVETYIQSGNVLFSSAPTKAKEFPGEVAAALQKHCGLEPEIFVLGTQELDQAIEANPFRGVEPSSLHFYFLSDDPQEFDLSGVISPSEQFELMGKVFYLHAPDGIGRSKLVARLEKLLGVLATGRNGKTLLALQKKIRSKTLS